MPVATLKFQSEILPIANIGRIRQARWQELVTLNIAPERLK